MVPTTLQGSITHKVAMPKKNLINFPGKSVSDLISHAQRQKIASQRVVNLEEYRTTFSSRPCTRVLIIDHDDMTREAVQRVLKADGYECYAAGDAIELAQVMSLRKLEVLVIDVDIPWVDGFELCSLIKKHPKSCHLPVILVGDQEGQDKIKEEGYNDCDGFLSKPLDVDLLTGMMTDLLEKNP